jgi:hypothetical protein
MYLTGKPPKSPTCGTYSFYIFSPPFEGLGAENKDKKKNLHRGTQRSHRETQRVNRTYPPLGGRGAKEKQKTRNIRI